MSGGSHGYIYSRIEEELGGQMQDAELNDLVEDFVKLAHDLEWMDSSDISPERYRVVFPVPVLTLYGDDGKVVGEIRLLRQDVAIAVLFDGQFRAVFECDFCFHVSSLPNSAM